MAFWILIASALASFGLTLGLFWRIFRWAEKLRAHRRARHLSPPWSDCPKEDLPARLSDAVDTPAAAIEGDRRSCLAVSDDGRTISLLRFGARGPFDFVFLATVVMLVAASSLWIATGFLASATLPPWMMAAHAAIGGGELALLTTLLWLRRRTQVAQIFMASNFIYLRTRVGGVVNWARCPFTKLSRVEVIFNRLDWTGIPSADIAFITETDRKQFTELAGYHPGLDNAAAELLAKQINGLLTPPPASALARSA